MEDNPGGEVALPAANTAKQPQKRKTNKSRQLKSDCHNNESLTLQINAVRPNLHKS